MSSISVNHFKKKLRRFLAACPPAAFFTMIWAIRAAQSGNQEAASQYLYFPKEFATKDIASNYYIPPWTLEDALSEYFNTPKGFGSLVKKSKVVDCRQFESVRRIFGLLGALRNEQSGENRKSVHVLDELPRIAHKQFPWQRRYLSYRMLYRSMFIYGGPICKTYFEKTFEFTYDVLLKYSMALISHFQEQPFSSGPPDARPIFITKAESNKIFRYLTAPLNKIIECSNQLSNEYSYGEYTPNALHRFPCVELGDGSEANVFCPLPDLIALRISNNLYYDLIKAEHAAQEIGSRFESYCKQLCEYMIGFFETQGEFEYKRNGKLVKTPDILLSSKRVVKVIIECKSKRLNLPSKFSPLKITRPDGWDEIVKAVKQIWQFRYDANRKAVQVCVDANAIGIVLTIEPWTVLNQNRYGELLSEARDLTRRELPEFSAVDECPVAVCQIEDFESILEIASSTNFVPTFRTAATKEYSGWLATSILRTKFEPLEPMREFPYSEKIGELIPWWNEIF